MAKTGKKQALPDAVAARAEEAPQKLLAIAEDPETPVKLAAEIYKWMLDRYGGAQDETAQKNVTVTFEGELLKWSE